MRRIDNSQFKDSLPEIPNAIKELYGIDTPGSHPAAGRASSDISDATDSFIAPMVKCVMTFAFIIVCFLVAGGVNRVLSDLGAIDLVNSNHGMTFEDFCEGTRHEPYEYWGVFDETGKKLGECTSHNVGCVQVPTELLEYGSRRGATTSVHCHPGYNCPFSMSDLLNFVAVCLPLDITTACVVSEDYLYRLEKPDDVEVDQIGFRVFLGLYVKYRQDDPTYFQYVTLADGTSGYISTDALITEIADEFGLIFTKTPLD